MEWLILFYTICIFILSNVTFFLISNLLALSLSQILMNCSPIVEPQSMTIATDVVSSNLDQVEVYNIMW
jgi:hypothetical protein